MSGSQWLDPPELVLGERGRRMQVSVHGEFAREDNEAAGLDGCFCLIVHQLSLSRPQHGRKGTRVLESECQVQ